jgi:hypothetical protein
MDHLPFGRYNFHVFPLNQMIQMAMDVPRGEAQVFFGTKGKQTIPSS